MHASLEPTPHKSLAEAELLQQIDLGFPSDWWERYEALKAKRRAEALTSEEHTRLIEMSDRLEEANARRMRALVELASLRSMTLEALMERLGLQTPAHA